MRPRWILIAALAVGACAGDVESPDADPTDPTDPPDPSDPPDPPAQPDASVVQPMPPTQGDPIPLQVVGTNGNGLHLRSGPDTTYAIIATIPEGDWVTPTGPPQTIWLPVTWNSLSGWVYGAYLSH